MDITAMIKLDDEKIEKDVQFKLEDELKEKDVELSLSYSQSCQSCESSEEPDSSSSRGTCYVTPIQVKIELSKKHTFTHFALSMLFLFVFSIWLAHIK